MGSTRISFGDFSLEPDSLELWRGERKIRLRPQPARVLLLLLQRPGEVVTREDLAQLLWPDSHVEVDQGLNSCIRQLRRSLGDSAAEPRYVETLPRIGYRFIGSVTDLGGHGAEREPEAAPAAPVPPGAGWRIPALAALLFVAVVLAALAMPKLWRSDASSGSGEAAQLADPLRLAVLAVENPGDDADLESLSLSLTDDLIAEAASVAPEQLLVIAPYSASRYRGQQLDVPRVAEELAVEYLLTASLEPGATGPLLEVRLHHAGEPQPVWSDQFAIAEERPGTLQREVTSRLLAVLPLPEPLLASAVARSRGLEPPLEPEVRRLILQGQFLHRQSDPASWERSADSFRRALELSPGQEEALSGLGRSLYRQRRFDEAKATAQRLLRVAPEHVNGHLLLAAIAFLVDWDWDRASHHYQRALISAPWDARCHWHYGYFLAVHDRGEEALVHLRRAAELDPISPLVLGDLGMLYLWLDRYEEAAVYCRRTVELVPENFFGQSCLLEALQAAGRSREALEQARTMMAAAGAEAGEVEALESEDAERGLAEFWRWWLEHHEEEWLAKPGQHYALALTYAAADRWPQVLDLLLQAHDQRIVNGLMMIVDPRFRPLATEPRYLELMRELELPGAES